VGTGHEVFVEMRDAEAENERQHELGGQYLAKRASQRGPQPAELGGLAVVQIG